ncbi:hypothetical protein RB195_025695 [Necator americanus]|uniref:Uncharacterized protein n=1 Tax=Necator americanus TaxID=51031 RepID=A0ABR1ETF4_NECAM
MPHQYISPLQLRNKNWYVAWNRSKDSEQQSWPSISLLEMLLYVLDNRKANEAARNFHMRQVTKSRDMAPVERKTKKGRLSLENRR